MRKKLHTIKGCYWSSVAFFTMMSLSFVAMPIANYVDINQQSVILSIVGTMFWGALAGGYAFLIKAYKNYKELLQSSLLQSGRKKSLPGFFKIFSNTAASIIDILLIVDIAAIALIATSESMNGFFTYIILAIFIFSIHMHCMFNGNIYNEMISVKKENEK